MFDHFVGLTLKGLKKLFVIDGFVMLRIITILFCKFYMQASKLLNVTLGCLVAKLLIKCGIPMVYSSGVIGYIQYLI